MNVQDIFYVTGIIFFGLSILILLVMGILLFFIKQKITDIHHNVETQINQVMNIAKGPVKTAADITASLLPGNKKTAKRRK